MSEKDDKAAEKLGVELEDNETKPRLAPVDDYPERSVEEATMSQKEAEEVGGGAVPRAYKGDDPEKTIPADSYEAKRQERGRRTGANRQSKPGADGPGVRKEG